MTDYLEKLRQKPDDVKKSYALVTSGTVVGIIALVWFGTFSIRNQDILGSQTAAVDNSGTSQNFNSQAQNNLQNTPNTTSNIPDQTGFSGSYARSYQATTSNGVIITPAQ